MNDVRRHVGNNGSWLRWVFSRLFDRPHFPAREQAHFAKRLSFLINAGVPLLESLHILREQAGRQGHRRILEAVVDDVGNGQTLSHSLGKFPRIFNDFSVHIIRVGEMSGTLATNLEYLAEEMKKKQVLKNKIKSALVYPSIIALGTLGITAFLMLYLFPKIMPIFMGMHTSLPLSTRMVMAISVFLQHWGLLLVVLAVVFACIATTVIKHNSTAHVIFDAFLLRAPVIGRIVQIYNVASACRTLGVLLKSGIGISEALSITADTSVNRVYRREFRRLAHTVERGENISQGLHKRRVCFPEIMSHMVAVGEKSGTLADSFVYLSGIYEHEVDECTKNLSTLLEPALMIVMGIIVGFIAISIITPIYGMTQNIHG